MNDLSSYLLSPRARTGARLRKLASYSPTIVTAELIEISLSYLVIPVNCEFLLTSRIGVAYLRTCLEACGNKGKENEETTKKIMRSPGTL